MEFLIRGYPGASIFLEATSARDKESQVSAGCLVEINVCK